MSRDEGYQDITPLIVKSDKPVLSACEHQRIFLDYRLPVRLRRCSEMFTGWIAEQAKFVIFPNLCGRPNWKFSSSFLSRHQGAQDSAL